MRRTVRVRVPLPASRFSCNSLRNFPARLFELLPEHPIVSIAGVVGLLETTKPTATKAVRALIEAGILVETTGRRRDRTFGYAAYLGRLRAGTELDRPR